MADDILDLFVLKIKKMSQKKIITKYACRYREYDRRGKAYIYNATDKDIDELIKQMRHLGFNCKQYDEKHVFLTKLENYRSDKNQKLTDDYCAAVIIIEYADKNIFKFHEQIIKPFHSDCCKKLECKPKLFFHLKVPKRVQLDSGKGMETEDSEFVYKMPVESDLFIYQHESPDCLDNLCVLLRNIGENQEDINVQNEIIAYMDTLTDELPTIHQTLTRRLELGHKKVVHDKNKMINKNINRKLSSAIDFIEDLMDYGDEEIPKVYKELNIDPVDIRNKIAEDSYCQIPDAHNIVLRLESAINDRTNEDN